MVSGYLPGQMAGEQDWLRERLEELEQIDRPSASDGERRAAEWLVERFAELGAQARIEAETAHGTYWWPLGIGAALGAVAALRGRRALGALLGTIGAADIGARQIMPGATSPASRLRESTFFLCLESIGSPHLLVIRGEGFLKMHELPAALAGLDGRPRRQRRVRLRRRRHPPFGGRDPSPRRAPALSGSNHYVTNPDYALGIRLYSIRSRAIP